MISQNLQEFIPLILTNYPNVSLKCVFAPGVVMDTFGKLKISQTSLNRSPVEYM